MRILEVAAIKRKITIAFIRKRVFGDCLVKNSQMHALLSALHLGAAP